MLSVVQPKAPNNPAWKQVRVGTYMGYAHVDYVHEAMKLQAISAVECPDGEPEYHLSISRFGPRRCRKSEAEMVVKQFDLEGALEDNHSSIIRNYWMPVAESNIGRECECKADETAIVEGDFEWRPLTKENAERAK